jgi:hypothetical protein
VHRYGSRLWIGFIGRRDQIFLKLHAAVDRAGGRHLQDLKPTAAELLDAAKWTRTQNPSENFRMLLGTMLKYLGHENLVQQI